MNAINSVLAIYGLHSEATAKKFDTTITLPSSTKKMNLLQGAREHNLLLVMGYIPVIGTVVGIARIIASTGYLLACRNNLIGKPDLILGWTVLSRAIVEMTSCGVILIAIDTIVSVGRLMQQCCLTPAY